MWIAAVILRASFVMGVLGLGLAAASSSPYPYQVRSYVSLADQDCPDFATKQEAQEYFVSNGGSPDNNFDRLDRDGDGLACESLPGEYSSSPPVTTAAPPSTSPPQTGPAPTSAPTSAPKPASPTGGTLAGLVVAPEKGRDGFDRAGVDYDRDLLLEASFEAHGCYLSVADKFCHTDAGAVEVDHLVALAEAWDSRPAGWTVAELEVVGADVDNLWLMTAALNGQKSDRDPSAWLPPADDQVCGYVRRYVAVKREYHLRVDVAERDALVGTGCFGEDSGVGAGADGGGTYSTTVSNDGGDEAAGVPDPVGGLPLTGPGFPFVAFVLGGVLLVGGAVAFVVTRYRSSPDSADSPAEEEQGYPQLWVDPAERWANRHDRSEDIA